MTKKEKRQLLIERRKKSNWRLLEHCNNSSYFKASQIDKLKKENPNPMSNTNTVPSAEAKAKELVNIFRPYADRGRQDSERNEIESAKQCALICVDEMILENTISGMYEQEMFNASLKYWNEVKQEIDKL